MQHWEYFYERSIGCVGVLKDWLIRALAAALYDKSKVLSLEYLQDHALSLAQCERMAIDAIEGEQLLSYAESRREPLWRLLGDGMDITPNLTPNPSSTDTSSSSGSTESNKLTTTKNLTDTTQQKAKSQSRSKQKVTSISTEEIQKSPSKKRRKSNKTKEVVEIHENEDNKKNANDEVPPPKKTTRRVGQRKPRRDTVGS